MIRAFEKGFVLWLFFITALFFGFYNIASAQTFAEVSLGLSPKNPEPHETVTVSLGQVGVDTFGSNIRWYVDEIEQTNSRNERSIEIKVGNLGEASKVRVSVSQNNNIPLSSSITIRPTVVDIILESDTHIPYFYKGRSLPSSEANVRAIAVINDGTHSSPSSYTYRWRLEANSLFGGPVKSKYVAELEIPRFGNKRLSVEVTDSGGNMVASDFVILEAHPPELHFYEENPLRGLQEKVVGSELYLFGEETTVSGEPYYMRSELDSLGTSFDWEIDGRSVPTNSDRPNAITLQRIGESGSSDIKLEVITKGNLPQFVRGAFRLLFN